MGQNEVFHSHSCLVSTNPNVVLQLWMMDMLPSLHSPTLSSLICIVSLPLDLPYLMDKLWKNVTSYWGCTSVLFQTFPQVPLGQIPINYMVMTMHIFLLLWKTLWALVLACKSILHATWTILYRTSNGL